MVCRTYYFQVDTEPRGNYHDHCTIVNGNYHEQSESSQENFHVQSEREKYYWHKILTNLSMIFFNKKLLNFFRN
jgi:hypothetical protein